MKNPNRRLRRPTRTTMPVAPSATSDLSCARVNASPDAREHASHAGESGYTLVALLALMTILMIAIMAAVPSVRQQKQRELEMEAIARGEEVAEAIRLYVRRPGGGNTLPTTMEQLTEGIPFGTKKIQILRPSAAHDPLSTTGEWRLIRLADAEMIEFKDAVLEYATGRAITTLTTDPILQTYVNRLMTSNSSRSGDSDGGRDGGGGEIEGTNTGGPFIGVASRSRRASVITYYGIERHDRWVFTPLFR